MQLVTLIDRHALLAQAASFVIVACGVAGRGDASLGEHRPALFVANHPLNLRRSGRQFETFVF